MADNTIIQQGQYTATNSNKFIPLRSGVDWFSLYNTTVMSTNVDLGVYEAYWQLGMPSGAGILKYLVVDTPNSSFPNYTTSGGFTLVDTSLSPNGTVNTTLTAVSTASIPVATNTGTNGLGAGSIVRLFNVAGAPQLGSMDYTVGYNTLSGTTFSLDYMAQLSVAGTTGSWMVVNFDPIFYPRRRFITKISKATQAVVTLSVTHGYQVGQIVRMVVPAAFGMIEMNGLQATIVAVNTTTTTGNTITLDIDSSAFTAFAFPLAAAFPFTYAETVPLGEDTAYALYQGVNILSDATMNTAQIGMLISWGATAAGGVSGENIYWRAGKSFSNTLG